MERESTVPPATQFHNVVEANIVITGGLEDGYIVPISSQGLTIGRLPDNDIVINEPWVSRKHAQILCIGTQHLLKDLSSSNGTFVLDNPIGNTQHLLEDGDQIRFGRSTVQLIFRFSGAVTMKMSKNNVLADGVHAIERSPSPESGAGFNTLASLESVPSDQQLAEFTAPTPGDELIEGDVRLNVSAAGDLRKMFQFVHELRQNSQLRVLRLARGTDQDITIWLGLREQVPLKSLLVAIECVSKVAFKEGEGPASERTFDIVLSA